jgi:O-antigen/teichoic acid export membrane protein
VQQLVGGVGWTAFALGFERLISLVQTIYIARLLGAEDYGRYGLVFLTAGLIASLAGLQLGLTATVHVSKHARSDPQFAGAIIRLCEFLSVSITLIVIVLLASAPGWVSTHLLGGKSYIGVLDLAALIVLFSVFGGVQDGVLQGFQQFRSRALARVGVTAAGLLALFLIGRAGSLGSVLLAVTLGTVLRTIVVTALKEIQYRRERLSAPLRVMWNARGTLLHFSVPSVLASVIAGGVSWYAMLLVSKVKDGFHGVAYLTTGQQWQGTVTFISAFMVSVALPMMSKLLHEGDVAAARGVHRANLVLNLSVAALAVVAVCLCSTFILRAYGRDFGAGYAVFWTMVIAALPAVYINVMILPLVAKGRMWEQLLYYAANYLPLLVGYSIMIPRYGSIGYAVVLLVVNLAFCAFMYFRLSDSVDAGPIRPEEIS